MFYKSLCGAVIVLAGAFFNQGYCSGIQTELSKECFNVANDLKALAVNETKDCVDCLDETAWHLTEAGDEIDLENYSTASWYLEEVLRYNMKMIAYFCLSINDLSEYKNKVKNIKSQVDKLE